MTKPEPAPRAPGSDSSDTEGVSKSAVYLNRVLPKTRTIAQALIRDSSGRIMLCELAYKKFWDLPGGVVDPHESPAAAVIREVAEELGAEATISALRVISWLPPWRGWDDAMLYVFDITLDLDVDAFTLQTKEIKAVHHVALSDLDDHVAPYTARVIREAVDAIEHGEKARYLEDGVSPVWV